jgi:uncharacterized protein (DUF849 family)
MIEACLNGSRPPSEHPALPRTADDLAREAVSAVATGAACVHIHPKNHLGQDSLEPDVVAAAVQTVRRAVPSSSLSVTTGEWAATSPSGRLALIRRWRILPDRATVNWHEPGAEELAACLLERGVSVEVGLTSEEAAQRFVLSQIAPRCSRVLIEIGQQPPPDAISLADRIVSIVTPAARPLLLHGEGDCAWPVLRHAIDLGLSTRIGFEDVLSLPDGSAAESNADLVRAAVALAAVESSPSQGSDATPTSLG